MLTVVLGVVGALIFGSADFLGGLASQRISPLRVTAVAAAAGLVLLLAAAPFVGGTWSASAVLWGGLSGVSGALAISLLYASLAIGPMSILSPLTAVISAIVPMTWGLVAGTRFAPIGYVGLALALVAVVLVGFVPEKGAVRPRVRGIVMSIGSGLMIGAFMILIAQTPHNSGLAPLVMNRAVNATLMFASIGTIGWLARRRALRSMADAPGAASESRAAAAARAAGHSSAAGAAGHSTAAGAAGESHAAGATHLASNAGIAGATLTAPAANSDPAGNSDPAAIVAPAAGWRPGLALAIACGIVDAIANTLLLVGIRLGDLTVMSVLTALYPAGTIILAAVVLRERIAPVQWAGLVLALVASGMFALA